MFFNKYTRAAITVFIGSLFIASGIFFRNGIEKRYNSTDEFILKRFPSNSKINLISKDKNFNISELHNPILVHFWATWCGPCEAELPDFIKFSRSFGNVNFLIVASKDDLTKVLKFIKKFGDVGPNVFFAFDESGNLMKDFGTLRLPETYFFDENLDIVKKFVGPQDWLNEYFYNNFKYLISL